MSNNIVLKKGLDIPITGEAGKYLSKTYSARLVAVRPDDFRGLLPRLLVREGDTVLCGSPVLSDKKNASVIVTSPVSGTVKEIVRGERRKLLAVIISADEEQKYVDFGAKDIASMSAGEVKEALLASGLWPSLVQRPYGTVADPSVRPGAIFVSAFSTAPLAPDYDFILSDKFACVQAGINALAKLTDGGVHVSLPAGSCAASPFRKLENASIHVFEGRHPAGNVGVQISHIRPLTKGVTLWTVSLQSLADIGAFLTSGKLNLRRKIAVTGPAAIEPSYVELLPGTPMRELAAFYGGDAEGLRLVSGDPLSGTDEGEAGFVGYFDNQVTILHEGTEKELLGWANPLRWKQFSTDRSYFSWLTPWRKYDMDTNLHGGKRAFVMSDAYYSKVLPMEIYPLYLIKACLAGDIDKMEKFGIYEVLPEDFATVEYIDPSKNDIQDIIRRGIDLMIKEMA